MRTALNELTDPSDISTLTAKVNETTSWLDRSASASKEEYEEMQAELVECATPIVRRPFLVALTRYDG